LLVLGVKLSKKIGHLAFQGVKINLNVGTTLMVQKSSFHQFEIGSFSHYLKGNLAPSQVVIAGFLNHQEYHLGNGRYTHEEVALDSCNASMLTPETPINTHILEEGIRHSVFPCKE